MTWIYFKRGETQPEDLRAGLSAALEAEERLLVREPRAPHRRGWADTQNPELIYGDPLARISNEVVHA